MARNKYLQKIINKLMTERGTEVLMTPTWAMSGIRLLLIFQVHSKKLVTPRCKYLATRQGFVFAGNLDDVQM